VSQFEIALGLGNNVLQQNTLEYHCGNLIQNSEFEGVIQYCTNFKESGRAINLNFDMATYRQKV